MKNASIERLVTHVKDDFWLSIFVKHSSISSLNMDLEGLPSFHASSATIPTVYLDLTLQCAHLFMPATAKNGCSRLEQCGLRFPALKLLPHTDDCD